MALKMGKLEGIHKKNFRLIERYSIKRSSKFKLKKDFKSFNKGDIFHVFRINPHWGWVTFEETERLPQEVSELIKIGRFD